MSTHPTRTAAAVTQEVPIITEVEVMSPLLTDVVAEVTSPLLTGLHVPAVRLRPLSLRLLTTSSSTFRMLCTQTAPGSCRCYVLCPCRNLAPSEEEEGTVLLQGSHAPRAACPPSPTSPRPPLPRPLRRNSRPVTWRPSATTSRADRRLAANKCPG